MTGDQPRLWVLAHTPRNLPPGVTRLVATWTTMLWTFCPAKSLAAAAPAVPCESWATRVPAVVESSVGQPEPSKVSVGAAVATAAAVALKPVRLKKKGSSRRPAKTRASR